MRKNFTSKKAVSPVIATVLMILVTMVGMTLLFAFVTSYSETYKEGVGSQVLEVLTVEDIWINPTGVTNPPIPINVTIYNAGKIDSQITSVYLNGIALTQTSGGHDFNIENQIVEAGSHLTLKLYQNSALTGNSYTFTVGTKAGSTFDVTYNAP